MEQGGTQVSGQIDTAATRPTHATASASLVEVAAVDLVSTWSKRVIRL
jgi:hypothetical protein